jgi:hypothetical protein
MSLQKSGFYYANKFMRLYLDGLHDLMGPEAWVDLLKAAGIPQFIKHPVPDNLEKSIDFAYFTAIQTAFEGLPDGEALARQSGRRVFVRGFSTFAPQMNLTHLAEAPLPLADKLKVGLPAMAQLMNQFSDQISQAYPWDDSAYIFTMERCPMCWKRQSQKPVCFAGQGLLQEALHWASGGAEFEVEMRACIAQGDEMGQYRLHTQPLGLPKE